MWLKYIKSKNIDSIKIMSFLVYLIPISLLTGPFLPDLFLVTASLIFISYTYNKKIIHYFKSKFFIIFLFFYIYILINSLFSEYPYFSLKSSFFYIRYGIFSLAVWFLLETRNNFSKYFFYSILLAFFLALFDGYFQYVFGSSMFGYEAANNNRLNLVFSNGWLLGTYLVRLFPLLLALTLLHIKLNNFNIIVILVLWVLTDVLIYLSGERAAIALMILSNIFLILLLKDFWFLRISSFIISIFIILVVSISNPEIKQRNIDLTLHQIGIGQGKINYFSILHQGYIFTGLSMFNSNKLFGIGANNYRKLCDVKEYKYISRYSTENYTYSGCSTHPHNSYIQLLAETGIVGILFILVFAMYFFKSILMHIYYRIRNKIELYVYNDYQICLVACFLCTLWPIVPTMNFFNNWINICYFLPVGFYLHSIYSKNNNLKNSTIENKNN